MKFPVFSLLTGNFKAETSSLETAPSSTESTTNPCACNPLSDGGHRHPEHQVLLGLIGTRLTAAEVEHDHVR
jgi:hypothetical protein